MSLPRDLQNAEFVKWFHPEEKAEYKEFFDQYGFVAVKVLSPEECEESIEDIWDYVESTNFLRPDSNQNKIVRNDWTTCSNNIWPGMRAEGILGPRLAFSPVAFERRQNPKVYEVFAELLGTPEIMCNHDRYGLFRPTKNVRVGHNETKNFTEWKTKENLHLDGNPYDYVLHPQDDPCKKLDYRFPSDFIEENNHLGAYDEGNLYVQGLLNFMDNRVQDGGFQLVPGFSKNIKEWTTKTNDTLGARYRHQTFLVLPPDLPELKAAERISVPAGCVIIWNQYTAHGSKPNYSERPRFCQFIKYFPAINIHSERGRNRAAALWKQLEQVHFVPSSLGKKIFGLREFNPQ